MKLGGAGGGGIHFDVGGGASWVALSRRGFFDVGDESDASRFD